MKWFINDLKAAFAELKRGATWLVIATMAGFFLLSFIVADLALQTDTMLRFLHITSFNCRELSNTAIIFLFCAMIFFSLTVLSTFGEIQRYFHLRDRRAHHQARQAKIYGAIWGTTAISIAVASVIFFKFNCW